MSILLADGSVYKAPEQLDIEEMMVIQKTLGMSARNGWKPTRKEFRWGILAPDSPTTTRLNDMQSRGLIRMFLDGHGLSKKDIKRFKAGDFSKGAIVTQVTREGVDSYVATAKHYAELKAQAARDEKMGVKA